jgi:predicted CopG family antitoxin
MYAYIYIGDSMVRVISISDEVYSELSRMKEGKSFTELIKTLVSECTKKGDAKSILLFLNAKGPLSDESAKNITDASEKGRKSTNARKSASIE